MWIIGRVERTGGTKIENRDYFDRTREEARETSSQKLF
jgi:hypothetical protein